MSELRAVISAEDHVDALYYMSVVKCMLWNLIIQLNPFIGVEDKVE